eukprot:15324174-Ditylum_brightwellii.AAC.1
MGTAIQDRVGSESLHDPPSKQLAHEDRDNDEDLTYIQANDLDNASTSSNDSSINISEKDPIRHDVDNLNPTIIDDNTNDDASCAEVMSTVLKKVECNKHPVQIEK